MTDGRRARLSIVPGVNEQKVFDWIGEPEVVDARPVLDRAFAALPRTRQVARRPWDQALDRLRPEPFGRPRERALSLLLAAALATVALVGGLISGAIKLPVFDSERTPPPPTPVVSLPASAAPESGLPASPAVFPLAGMGLELVIEELDGSLSIVASDGTQLRPIAADIPGELRSPEWLPGTERVLAQETTDITDQIWDIDTTGARRSLVVIPCVEPCVSRNEAAPSRDGLIVYFQAIGPIVDTFPTTCGLAIYDVSTQATSIVTESPCGIEEERHPRFSPDGSSLAFWRTRSPTGEPSREVGSAAIFVRDLATGDEVQVTEWTFGASVLDWSPDGAWIAFVRQDWLETATPDGDIWRVRADGTDLEQLTSIDTSELRLQRPRYTPDGSWILFRFTDSSGIRMLGVPAGGGEPVEILPGSMAMDFDMRPLE